MVSCYKTVSNQYSIPVIIRVLCAPQNAIKFGGTLITLLSVIVDYMCFKTSALKNLNNYMTFRWKMISCIIWSQNGVLFNVEWKYI